MSTEEEFIKVLERAIIDILESEKANRKEKNEAIANGIKLLAIRHKVTGTEDVSFFGDK